MKTFQLTTLFFFFLAFQNLYSQWEQQQSGVSNTLLRVEFLNKDTGWVCGTEGIILRTTDSGNSWEQQTSTTISVLRDIFIINSHNIVVIGDSSIFLKSSDLGNTWNKRNIYDDWSLCSIHFVDSLTALIAGGELGPPPNYYQTGVILKTNNGGNNWYGQIIVSGLLRDISLFGINFGWCVGEYPNYLTTSNGGSNWEQHATSRWDRSVFPIDSLKIWTCGYNGNIHFSSDGVYTWILKYHFGNGGYNTLEKIFFADYNYGWAGGQCYIFATSDEGENWIPQYYDIDEFISDICFLDKYLGWAVGKNGTILKTINGGGFFSTNIEINNNEDLKFSLSPNYPNPFNPVTKIKYQIPISPPLLKGESEAGGFITLKVYDLLGREVATLVNDEKLTGEYEVEFDGTNLPSGIYFYQLKAGSFVETRKMVFMK